MFALQRNAVAPNMEVMPGYRLSMFALQLCVQQCRTVFGGPLPLEHVRVATLRDGHDEQVSERLPLEHVRVATSLFIQIVVLLGCYRLSMFALQP